MTAASPVAEEAAELRRALAAAKACTAIHDADTAAMIGPATAAHSTPPWNPQAAYAVTGIHAAVRDIEARLYREVTGQEPRTRGGSDRNTILAIERIPTLAAFAAATQWVIRELRQITIPALQLPAVGERDRWIPIRLTPGDHKPPLCPYCGHPSLRLAERAYVVMCFYPSCADGDGNRPHARLDVNRLDGTPVLIGADGSTW